MVQVLKTFGTLLLDASSVGVYRAVSTDNASALRNTLHGGAIANVRTVIDVAPPA